MKTDKPKYNGKVDATWLKEDNERREMDNERKRAAMKRHLAEIDAAYAKAFPQLVRRRAK